MNQAVKNATKDDMMVNIEQTLEIKASPEKVFEGLIKHLCNLEGEVYALQGYCSHEQLPLDGGEIEDGILTCEWHGAQFDVRTGAVCSPPASIPLRGFDTRVDDEGRVFVTIG